MNDFVEFLINNNALLFGEFITKSGRQTPYFINTGELNSGKQLMQLAEYYADLINSEFPEANIVFGPAYKGIPLAVATSMMLFKKYGKNTDFSSIRKEKKEHGDKGIFLGKTTGEGDKIVLIDDVFTTGATKKQAIDMLIKTGAQVLGIVIAVDRNEKQDEKIEKTATQMFNEETGITVKSIITLKDILEFLKRNRPEDYEKCLSYVNKYCVL